MLYRLYKMIYYFVYDDDEGLESPDQEVWFTVPHDIDWEFDTFSSNCLDLILSDNVPSGATVKSIELVNDYVDHPIR